MCLIIRTKKDLPISEALLKNMHKRNDDGFGFMWIANNKLNVFKSEKKEFKLLWDKYNELKEFDPFIHLRYKTHGAIDWTNTHPYACGHGIYLMHNGIIRVDDSEDLTKSDTWHFIDQLIKPLIDLSPKPHELIRSKKFKKIMEMQLGSTNRMVFGDRGGYVPFGEGNWHKITNTKTGCVGMWVSNTYAWDAMTFDPNPKPPVIVQPTGVWTNPHPRSSQNYTNPQAVYYQGQPNQHRLKDDKIIYWQGGEYHRINNNLYCNEDGDIYMNNNLAMRRRMDLDKEYGDLAKGLLHYIQTPPVPKTEPVVVVQPQLALVVSGTPKAHVPDLGITTKHTELIKAADAAMVANDDDIAEAVIELSEKDMDRLLTKEWLRRKPWEISTLVYTESDEAARVLNYLIANNGDLRV